jgi:hypothetical protein
MLLLTMYASKRGTPLGPVIGGAIGGVVVISSVLVALCIWGRARRQYALDSKKLRTPSQIKHRLLTGDGLSRRAACDLDSVNVQETFLAPNVSAMSPSWTGPESSTLPLSNTPTGSTIPSALVTQPTPSNMLVTSPLSLDSPTLPFSNMQTNSTNPPPAGTQPPLDNTSGRHPSAEDGLLLKRLDELQQSVAGIANVVDALRVEREATNRVVEPSSGTGRREPYIHPYDDPPSYDH